MSDEPQNETVVLENLDKVQGKPEGKHPHHGMEVICKEGTMQITIPPMMGHEFAGKYVRTEDTDNGRVVFRQEAALS